MRFEDETLMAYVDGELDDAARTAIEVALAADADLAKRIAQHRALRSRLHNAFDPVLEEPVPERLLAAARGESTSSGHSGRVVPLRRIDRARWSWPQVSALAASLVLGVLVGPSLLRTSAPLVTRDGALLAGDTLAHALSQQLASTQPADAPVQIGVSFRSRSGDYCRTFVLRGKSALAGLACNEHGAWRMEAVAASESAHETAGYRAAASGLPTAVASTLDALIAGEPFDARVEAAARDRNWSR